MGGEFDFFEIVFIIFGIDGGDDVGGGAAKSVVESEGDDKFFGSREFTVASEIGLLLLSEIGIVVIGEGEDFLVNESELFAAPSVIFGVFFKDIDFLFAMIDLFHDKFHNVGETFAVAEFILESKIFFGNV